MTKLDLTITAVAMAFAIATMFMTVLGHHHADVMQAINPIATLVIFYTVFIKD